MCGCACGDGADVTLCTAVHSVTSPHVRLCMRGRGGSVTPCTAVHARTGRGKAEQGEGKAEGGRGRSGDVSSNKVIKLLCSPDDANWHR